MLDFRKQFQEIIEQSYIPFNIKLQLQMYGVIFTN